MTHANELAKRSKFIKKTYRPHDVENKRTVQSIMNGFDENDILINNIANSDRLISNEKNLSESFDLDKNYEVISIPIQFLKPYSMQARKLFDNEDQLSLENSIKEYGVRNPLTVMLDKDDGLYEIISGERRWRAGKGVGLDALPCIILKNNNYTEEIALIENIQRKNLSTIELLYGVENYIKNHPTLTKDEVIKNLTISRAHFYRIMSLITLSDEAKEFANTYTTSWEKLLPIAKLPHNEQVIKLQEIHKVHTAIQSLNRDKQDRKINSKILEIKLKDGDLTYKRNFSSLNDNYREETLSFLKKIIEELSEEGNE